MIISIPISYYSTFVIEERFGFNKTTLKTFFIDLVKGTLMSLIIGGILLGAALFIYNYFSEYNGQSPTKNQNGTIQN